MLGVSTHGFFAMMWEMLWLRDVVSLIAKGLIYGLLAGLFACHEGLRGVGDGGGGGEPEAGRDIVARSIYRAVILALVGILIVNSGWFLLFYHAGPAFGPTLLEPRGG
jgi:phospholipid/cholesterol/gamma-HCH transport system permease protein